MWRHFFFSAGHTIPPGAAACVPLPPPPTVMDLMEAVEFADGDNGGGGSAGDEATGLEEERALGGLDLRPSSMGSAAAPKDAGVGPRRRGRGKKGVWALVTYKAADTGKKVTEKFLVKVPESVRLANVTIDADPHMKVRRVVSAARARAKAKAANGPSTNLNPGGLDVGGVILPVDDTGSAFDEVGGGHGMDVGGGGGSQHDEDPRDIYLANLKRSMGGTPGLCRHVSLHGA